MVQTTRGAPPVSRRSADVIILGGGWTGSRNGSCTGLTGSTSGSSGGGSLTGGRSGPGGCGSAGSSGFEGEGRLGMKSATSVATPFWFTREDQTPRELNGSEQYAWASADRTQLLARGEDGVKLG